MSAFVQAYGELGRGALRFWPVRWLAIVAFSAAGLQGLVPGTPLVDSLAEMRERACR